MKGLSLPFRNTLDWRRILFSLAIEFGLSNGVLFVGLRDILLRVFILIWLVSHDKT